MNPLPLLLICLALAGCNLDEAKSSYVETTLFCTDAPVAGKVCGGEFVTPSGVPCVAINGGVSCDFKKETPNE